jgi:AAA15 family ATPase/GTPase
MIKKIGIENFRVFKEFTEFEIKPITLLVGPNNAGKSSFTKLLLLLKNGVSKLNFEEGLHNLESFDKVINWENGNKYLKIRYDNKLPFLNENFFVDVIYTTFGHYNKIVGINISDKNASLLSFNLSADKDSKKAVYKLNFNIDLMLSLIYHDEKANFSDVADNRVLHIPEEDGGFYESNIYEGDLTLENFEEIYESITGYGFEENGINNNSGIGKIVLKHEISKLEKNFLLYDVFLKGKKVTQEYKVKIIELQKLFFSQVKIDTHEISINQLENCLLNANEQVKLEIKNYFSKALEEENTEIKETRLGMLLFTAKLFEPVNSNSYYENKIIKYQKTYFQQFSNFLKGLDEDFDTIDYISANRGSQKRILKNKSANDIDKIVVNFFNKSDRNRIYIEKIFAILEIPGKLTVERFENVISIVYLIINDKKVALSDLGFGYSQLIPIILKIATITATSDKIEWKSEQEWTKKRQEDKSLFEFFGIKQNRTLIIEEPEANLHPSLQSKLADMLVATIEFYPNINFIIETHSEYLIRKLQYLTADQNSKLLTTDSVIYYFNADKYITSLEPKVKRINIKENGSLDDKFGPGFYDETSRLQFDLMVLNKEQSN